LPRVDETELGLYIQLMDTEERAREVVANCLGYRTRKLARTVTRLYNDHLRPVGLNIAEMNLLAAIAAQGSVQPARLGRAMELEKSTLSRNSSRLVDRGLLEIRADPEGRGVLLALTRRGNEVLLDALSAWEEAQEQARTVIAEALPSLGPGRRQR
jgi:DNA-binding MarR family transcriptional regulator